MKDLDRIIIENTAFHSFKGLLDVKGCYCPSIEVGESDDLMDLANEYDKAMAKRGDPRRAYRYGTGVDNSVFEEYRRNLRLTK